MSILKRLKHQHTALKSYHKGKAAKTLQRKNIEELHEQLKCWQNRSNMYEEVCALLQKEKIATFQNGRYTDDIRQIHMELMAINVAARNVETIIRTVLKGQTNQREERLLEARQVALSHLKMH